MLQTAKEVSVVICSYTEKRWDNLLAAIASAKQQTHPVLEIIVVIDYTYSLFKRLKERVPDICVIENREEKGLSGARNSGSAVAQGTIIAYLDDDAVAAPDWIEQLLKCYTDPQIVGVGGKIEPAWPGLPSWFPGEFKWVVGCSYRGLPVHQAPVHKVIGANMTIRRQAWMAVGGFRTQFGCNHSDSKRDLLQKTSKQSPFSQFLKHSAGGEETELCLRVTQCLPDVRWIYTPDAIVYHHVASHRMRWSYFLWRCYDEGLSKSQIVKLHGSRNGLASERMYVYKTLPLGIARYIRKALLCRNMAYLMCAIAIVIGFSCTIIGYLIGTLAHVKD